MSDIIRHDSSDERHKQPVHFSKPDNLLDAALSNLPPEQRKELALKALERRLDIDAKAKEAELRHQASTVDMANTIHQIRALENSTKSDYTVKADYETASGHTNVEIKKANNTVIIVIAIVIGIIVLLLLANSK